MAAKRILLVEDEEDIAEILAMLRNRATSSIPPAHRRKRDSGLRQAPTRW
jgi:hypothetical protein